MRICKVKKAVHQQHMNGLINTWVFASQNMTVDRWGMAFYAIIEFIKHSICSWPALIQ